MTNYIIAFRLAVNSMRRLLTSPRAAVLGGLSLLLLHHIINPISQFAVKTGVAVTPWVFSHIFCDYYLQAMFMLGMVLLFCDAPFINRSTPYEYIRAGKKNWFLGQSFYIYLSSIVFMSFLCIMSMILLLPNIEFSSEWGKVYSTIAQTGAAQYSVMNISYVLIQKFPPIVATLLCMLNGVLISSLIGQTIFLLNLFVHRAAGIFSGLTLAFLPALCSVSGDWLIYYFAPTSWNNLEILDIWGTTDYPSLEYVIVVLIAVNFTLTLMTTVFSTRQKTAMEWIEK